MMKTLSKGKKLSGKIKSKSEDFIVEEITQNGITLELNKKYSYQELGTNASESGKFAIFILQKNNWNTAQALRAIAKKFRRGTKSVGFAGTKDRTSISTQLCSIFGIKAEEIRNIHVKDLAINGTWQSDSKVKFGDLLGNRFTIVVRETQSSSEISENLKELNGVFPNYFGEQRFGIRDNNFNVGLDILKGDFKGAADRFLTDTSNETKQEAIDARKRLAEEQDFKAALQYFPQYLKYERRMIEYLSKYPNNYANSIRSLPRSLSLMFVHSVEDYIFNKELEERINKREIEPKEGDLVCDKNSYSFPDISTIKSYNDETENLFVVGNIVGYDTKNPTDLETKMLEDLGISLESFKLGSIKELNCKGSFRALFAPYKDFAISNKNEDNVVTLKFSLPAGSYATVLMNEFFEAQIPK